MSKLVAHNNKLIKTTDGKVLKITNEEATPTGNYLKSITINNDIITFVDQNDNTSYIKGSEYIKIVNGQLVLNIKDGDAIRY